MQIAIVKRSDLAREGRWDAGFHIALQKFAERVEELRGQFTPDQATERLAQIRLPDLQCLAPLARGNRVYGRSLSTADAQVIVNEYPHLSLALVEDNLAPAIARIKERIASDEKALEALLTLTAPSTNKEGQ